MDVGGKLHDGYNILLIIRTERKKSMNSRLFLSLSYLSESSIFFFSGFSQVNYLLEETSRGAIFSLVEWFVVTSCLWPIMLL